MSLERRLETGLMDIYTTVVPGFQNFFRVRKTGFEWVHRYNTVLLICMNCENGGLNVFFKIKLI